MYLVSCLTVLYAVYLQQFVPSTEWVDKTFWVSRLAGVPGAAFAFWVTRKLYGDFQTPGQELVYYFRLFGGVFFFFWWGTIFVSFACPMLAASAFGERTEVTFVVRDPEARSSKGCANKVELKGLPYLLDRICSVPQDLRDTIKKDTDITLIGRGTSAGVFVTSVRY